MYYHRASIFGRIVPVSRLRRLGGDVGAAAAADGAGVAPTRVVGRVRLDGALASVLCSLADSVVRVCNLVAVHLPRIRPTRVVAGGAAAIGRVQTLGQVVCRSMTLARLRQVSRIGAVISRALFRSVCGKWSGITPMACCFEVLPVGDRPMPRGVPAGPRVLVFGL